MGTKKGIEFFIFINFSFLYRYFAEKNLFCKGRVKEFLKLKRRGIVCPLIFRKIRKILEFQPENFHNFTENLEILNPQFPKKFI